MKRKRIYKNRQYDREIKEFESDFTKEFEVESERAGLIVLEF